MTHDPPDAGAGGEQPQLHEGLLDDDSMLRFEADLVACAQLLEIRVRGASRAFSSDAAGLADAIGAVRSRDAAGAQIRYRFEDHVWVDTLMRANGGVRLIRMRVPDDGHP